MAEKEKKRKRIWVLNVAVDADELETRLEAAESGRLNPSQQKMAVGIRQHINAARNAANRKDPIPGRLVNWWRGALVEAAHRHLHAARAQMIDLFDENELRAEIPVAVARAQMMLRRDDTRRLSAEELMSELTRGEDRALAVRRLRPRLRRLIGDSYEVLDGRHAQLRSFRNILILSAAILTVLVVVTLSVVATHPTVMPFCFPNEVVTDSQGLDTTQQGVNCPTRSDTTGPTGGDILIVALLGALGGALAGSVSIRNLKGTSTAYDVPVALALLKVPVGALTAILALVAIRGDFVPGLSILDSQEQILAYALVFGFAQQIFTRLLDKQAQTILEGLPGGTKTEPPPTAATPAPTQPGGSQGEALAPPAPAELPAQAVEVDASHTPDEVGSDNDQEMSTPVVGKDEVTTPDLLTDQGQPQEERAMTDPTIDPDIDTSPLPPELTDDTAPPEEPETPIVDEDDDTELDDPDTEDDADEALEADIVEADNDEQRTG